MRIYVMMFPYLIASPLRSLLFPLRRVLTNVCADPGQVRIIADNMIPEVSLPHEQGRFANRPYWCNSQTVDVFRRNGFERANQSADRFSSDRCNVAGGCRSVNRRGGSQTQCQYSVQ